MTQEESKQLLNHLQELISYFTSEESKKPGIPFIHPQDILDQIPVSVPNEGLSLSTFVALFKKVIDQTPRTGSHRFFNQLYGGHLYPSVLADMLTVLLNNSMYTYKVAGPHILIEKEMIRLFNSFVGYSPGDGTLTSGGSISNLVAMIVARNEAQSTIIHDGLDGSKYLLYTSKESHYSIPKNAGIIGIGKNQVRLIDTDDRGRMIPEDLAKQIERDYKLGLVPFFINVTAGTTVLGTFDPIEAILPIAKRYNLWLHIDAAFGGTLLISRKYRGLLKGSDQSDSFTWDAHKMMGVPITTSFILVRQNGLLLKHFQESADYLFQDELDDLNPGHKSIQCGRRNNAFKVWAAWQAFGKNGYEDIINHQMDMANYAAQSIKQHPKMRLLLEPESPIVCFEVVDKSSEKICTILDSQGIVKVGYGTFNNHRYIRLVCVNPELKETDIDFFLDQVLSVTV